MVRDASPGLLSYCLRGKEGRAGGSDTVLEDTWAHFGMLGAGPCQAPIAGPSWARHVLQEPMTLFVGKPWRTGREMFTTSHGRPSSFIRISQTWVPSRGSLTTPCPGARDGRQRPREVPAEGLGPVGPQELEGHSRVSVGPWHTHQYQPGRAGLGLSSSPPAPLPPNPAQFPPTCARAARFQPRHQLAGFQSETISLRTALDKSRRNLQSRC